MADFLTKNKFLVKKKLYIFLHFFLKIENYGKGEPNKKIILTINLKYFLTLINDKIICDNTF